MRSPAGYAPGLQLTLLAQPAPAEAGVVGFLNVLVIRLRSLFLAAALSFESKMVNNEYGHSKNSFGQIAD